MYSKLGKGHNRVSIILTKNIYNTQSRAGHFKFVFSISILIYLTARSSPKSIFVSFMIKLLMVVVKPVKVISINSKLFKQKSYKAQLVHSEVEKEKVEVVFIYKILPDFGRRNIIFILSFPKTF
jgi:hypothetical protein